MRKGGGFDWRGGQEERGGRRDRGEDRVRRGEMEGRMGESNYRNASIH